MNKQQQSARDAAMEKDIPTLTRMERILFDLKSSVYFSGLSNEKLFDALWERLEGTNNDPETNVEMQNIGDASASIALYRIATESNMTLEEAKRIVKAANDERKAIQSEWLTGEAK